MHGTYKWFFINNIYNTFSFDIFLTVMGIWKLVLHEEHLLPLYVFFQLGLPVGNIMLLVVREITLSFSNRPYVHFPLQF